MFQHLKRLGTETAIYGISTIVGRFLNFLLVPFYTNVLAPGEYGIVAYIYSIIAFVTVIYSYGMESAYFKYSSTLEIGTPKQNFSTPFFSLLGSSIVFSLIITLLTSPLAQMLNISSHYETIVIYAGWILAFDAMAIIPFAMLRMAHKPNVFAAIKFINIVINVGLNIVLLVVMRIGIVGVFISGLVASVVTFLVLLPSIFRHLTKEFSTPLWKALLKFGLPYVPAGLASMVVQVIDRPILRALTNDATVGVYQANYRLGIFMMLVVSMYDYAWRPFYFSVVKEPNAKEIFARVLTYFLLFMSGIFLALTLFVENLVNISIFGKHLIHPSYWSGLNIVPIVLLGYMFLGISTNLSAGMYIQKKTQYAPAITFIGALVNIVANYILIPSMGMLGAAWATLLAYFAMAVTLYFVVQSFYPVQYEFSRMIKILAAVAVVMVLYYSVPLPEMTRSSPLRIGWKFGLLVLFLGLMYGLRFFEAKEISVLKRFLKRERTDEAPIEEGARPMDRDGV
ncbi:MAG: polysaccharide biosynthesis C-terminal domain-containing protein [Ignavibacteria bacterium]|nr:polysaccharide biosynthesis C-terminal domain-containing protein [Ignavibacteria bacterium]